MLRPIPSHSARSLGSSGTGRRQQLLGPRAQHHTPARCHSRLWPVGLVPVVAVCLQCLPRRSEEKKRTLIPRDTLPFSPSFCTLAPTRAPRYSLPRPNELGLHTPTALPEPHTRTHTPVDTRLSLRLAWCRDRSDGE